MTRLRFRAGAAVLGFFLALVVAAAQPRAAEGTSLDDSARILAGLAPSAGSPAAELAGQAGWKQHAQAMDQAWANMEKRQLGLVRDWTKQKMPPSPKTLYYMFSGPDFLYADAFFPDARTYILAGLEPVGGIPDPVQMAPAQLTADLSQMRGSLKTLLAASYFITKDMMREFGQGKVTGALPVISVFMVRTGKTIKDVTYLTLNADGTLIEHPAGIKSLPNAIRITFNPGPGSEDRTLYYFSTNLANGGFSKSGFPEFLKQHAPGAAFVKSGSYLLHGGDFSQVREFLLANTSVILQDDTGVPLAMFPAGWKVKPYGNYVGPIPIFKYAYQARLKELFKSAPAEPVKFGIGYRWQPHETAFMLATREATAEIAPPEGTKRQ
ncbi:MAG: hypothetical protein AB7G34_13325 [Hyphomicrobiales bacterium]